MAAKKVNLSIRQGETFLRVIRWQTSPFIYRQISAISQTAPVRITAVDHTLRSGWLVAVVSAQGMDEINAQYNPPREVDFEPCTVIDEDMVELNAVNASEYSAYTLGGYLQFYTPVDMTGYTARMQIKNKIGGTVLETLTPVIDNDAHTITLTISADATESYTWRQGVYDIEMEAPGGTVTTIFSGGVTVTREVTTV